jgi:hypothetical protein
MFRGDAPQITEEDRVLIDIHSHSSLSDGALALIEDKWLKSQRLSAESFDNKAGSIMGRFNWVDPRMRPFQRRLLLNPVTGEPQ